MSILKIKDKNGNVTEVPALRGEPGISPHIGENGNWFVGDTDTGVAAGGGGSVKEVLPNVVLFGDSITDVNADGDWAKELPNYANFASLRNYARGFATFTFKADSAYNITDTSNANIGNNVIWNQFNRLKNDVDNGAEPPNTIVILAGTNDIIQSKTLGDVSTAFTGSILDKDITTLTNFAQSIRYTCECIKQEYPMCQIILCTPWQISYGSGGVTYRDMIVSCAQRLSEKYIDAMYESGIYQYFETTGDVFKDSDGVHLSPLGGKKVAQFIARELYNKVNLRKWHLEENEDVEVILSSITATYSGGEVAVGTAVTALTGITVTALYSDGSKTTVTGYTLSGTIAEGNNTITVRYGGKTTSFVVVGIAESGGDENPYPATYTVTNTLTNVTSNNSTAIVTEGTGYTATLTADAGYTLDSVTVTMGGADITTTAYADGVVTIESVTGDVVIIATANVSTVVSELFHNYASESDLLDTTSNWNGLAAFNPSNADAYGAANVTTGNIINVYGNVKVTRHAGRLYVCAVDGNPDGTASVSLTIRKVVDYSSENAGIYVIPIDYENTAGETLMVLNAYGGLRFSNNIPTGYVPYSVTQINASTVGDVVTAKPSSFAIGFAYTTPQS